MRGGAISLCRRRGRGGRSRGGTKASEGDDFVALPDGDDDEPEPAAHPRKRKAEELDSSEFEPDDDDDDEEIEEEEEDDENNGDGNDGATAGAPAVLQQTTASHSFSSKHAWECVGPAPEQDRQMQQNRTRHLLRCAGVLSVSSRSGSDQWLSGTQDTAAVKSSPGGRCGTEGAAGVCMQP